MIGVDRGRWADGLQVGSSLLWVAQSALIAVLLQRLSQGAGADAVWGPAFGFLAIAAARAGLDAAGARLAFRAARRRLTAARRAAIEAVIGQDPLDPARTPAGTAASVVAEQAEALLPAATRFAVARLRVAIVPLAILLVVLPFSWAAALALAVAGPLIPLFMAIVGWRARAASEAHLGELGRLQGFLLDRLRGLGTLRDLRAVDRTARRLDEASNALRCRIMRVLRIAFVSSAVLELFSALGVAMVAVYVGFHLLGGLEAGAWGRRLSLGEGVFILLLAPAFFEPLRDLAAAWHDRAAGAAAGDALAGLAATARSAAEAGVAEAKTTEATATVAGVAATGPDATGGPPRVVLERCTVRHAGEPSAGAPAALPVLVDADLEIGAGERIAVVGPSGVGKSTLLAVIAGLVAPDGGRVVVGGRRLLPATRDAIQARIGWLAARPWLRATSIRDNVTLGRRLPPAAVDAALDAVGLAPLVARRPGGGSGMLSEDGQGLSGGEWIRIALARATVDAGRDLLLVDEPTAHLDAGTAAEVVDALLHASRGRTLVVATHDPLLAARMDRVVRIDAGRLSVVAGAGRSPAGWAPGRRVA